MEFAIILGSLFVGIMTLIGANGVVHSLAETGKDVRMGLAELTQAAQDVVDQGAALIIEVGVVGNSVTAEISRVEAAIAAAKGNGVDPALLDPITAQLATAKTNLANAQAALSQSQTALDAEQAPPASAPAPAPTS